MISNSGDASGAEKWTNRCFAAHVAMNCYIILNLLLFVISISIDFSTFVITVYKCILSCGGFYRWLMLTIYPTFSNSDYSPSFYKLSSTINSEVQHLTSPKPLFFAGTVFGNIFDNHMFCPQKVEVRISKNMLG